MFQDIVLITSTSRSIGAGTVAPSSFMEPHIEKHFTASDTVRDIVIGMSDGLTVPFALAAGLTGAISQTHLIVTAGFAEIAAGGIIPLSAYLLLSDVHRALLTSALVTLIALALFGGIKGRFTGVPVFRSALQTSLIGGLAAITAFGIARWIS